MTVLKDKMLVRFEFSEDGQEVISYTEFFNNEWGRLRDICVSPSGKIYLATSGYSWPSQPPNEIIELSNPDYNYSSINEIVTKRNLVHSFDLLGRLLERDYQGFVIDLFDNGSVNKRYLIK